MASPAGATGSASACNSDTGEIMTDLKRRAMLGALGTAIAAGMATSACGRAEPDASDATTRMESGPTAKVIEIGRAHV